MNWADLVTNETNLFTKLCLIWGITILNLSSYYFLTSRYEIYTISRLNTEFRNESLYNIANISENKSKTTLQAEFSSVGNHFSSDYFQYSWEVAPSFCWQPVSTWWRCFLRSAPFHHWLIQLMDLFYRRPSMTFRPLASDTDSSHPTPSKEFPRSISTFSTSKTEVSWKRVSVVFCIWSSLSSAPEKLPRELPLQATEILN